MMYSCAYVYLHLLQIMVCRQKSNNGMTCLKRRETGFKERLSKGFYQELSQLRIKLNARSKITLMGRLRESWLNNNRRWRKRTKWLLRILDVSGNKGNETNNYMAKLSKKWIQKSQNIQKRRKKQRRNKIFDFHSNDVMDLLEWRHSCKWRRFALCLNIDFQTSCDKRSVQGNGSVCDGAYECAITYTRRWL